MHLHWGGDAGVLQHPLLTVLFLGNPWTNLPSHPSRFYGNYVFLLTFHHRKPKPSKMGEGARVRVSCHVCAHMWGVSINPGDFWGRCPSRSSVSFWDSACISSPSSWSFTHHTAMEKLTQCIIKQSRENLTRLGRRRKQHWEVDGKKSGGIVPLKDRSASSQHKTLSHWIRMNLNKK